MKCLYNDEWECRYIKKSAYFTSLYPPIERCEVCIKAREAAQRLKERKYNLEAAAKKLGT